MEIKGIRGKRHKKRAVSSEADRMASGQLAERDKGPQKRMPRWWEDAPKVPEFRLPTRKRERMRKIDF